MLLQAVDTIQLLHDTSTSDQLDDIASLSDYTITENGSISDSVTLTQNFNPSRQLQAVLNSPLPESLAEFSTLHSKDYVLYGCTNTDSPTTQSSNSPLPSPLAYPTPPASHEAVAQASPFLDDSHHFSDASSYFDDKRAASFLDETSAQFFKDSKSSSELSDNEKILKLKNELFNESKSVLLESNSFYQNSKSLLSDNNSLFQTKIDHLQANAGTRLQDFNHQNLSFLDEPQNFLDDARNTSSPLSAAFFTATMSSAEEVKEALEEVLPNENLHGEETDDNDIDLYYLPSLSLQSQMMPNSDDPLLSSSPKDFAHKSQTQKFDFTIFSPPSAKKQKINQDDNVENNNTGSNKIPLTIHTELIPKESEVFLSPNSISSSSPLPSKSTQQSSSLVRKRCFKGDKYRSNHIFNSNLRRNTSGHFTPLPILDPQRLSTGLASNLLIKNNILDECFADVKDSSENFLIKAKINVGYELQAIIPTLISKTMCETKTEYPQDQIMWDPVMIKDEKSLQRYIDLSKSSVVFKMHYVTFFYYMFIN